MGRGRHSSVDFSNCEDGSFPAFQGECYRHTKEVRTWKEPLGLQTGRSCGSVHVAMLGGVGSSS